MYLGKVGSSMQAEHGAMSGKLLVTVLGTQSVVAVEVRTSRGKRREYQACWVVWRIKDEIQVVAGPPWSTCAAPLPPQSWARCSTGFSGEAP